MALSTIIGPGTTSGSFRLEASVMKECQVDIVIIGAGSAGLNAMAQAREAGLPAGTPARRFLTGPVGCEITGLALTPDGRPLSATVAIRKADGGPIGT